MGILEDGSDGIENKRICGKLFSFSVSILFGRFLTTPNALYAWIRIEKTALNFNKPGIYINTTRVSFILLEVAVYYIFTQYCNVHTTCTNSWGPPKG